MALPRRARERLACRFCPGSPARAAVIPMAVELGVSRAKNTEPENFGMQIS